MLGHYGCRQHHASLLKRNLYLDPLCSRADLVHQLDAQATDEPFCAAVSTGDHSTQTVACLVLYLRLMSQCFHWLLQVQSENSNCSTA